MAKIHARHWTFAGLFVLVTALMLLNLTFSTSPSPDTQKMFDYINQLPEGSVLIVSFDHEASSLPEMRPLGLALLRHLFAKNHKLIGVALLGEGTGIGLRQMQLAAREYNKSYGTDYAFLGFKPQYIAAILSMGESISSTFPEDYLGNKTSELELLGQIKNYDNIAGVISLADGSLTTHWIEYGRARYGIEVSAAVAAAMVTTYDPYLSSGQLRAMVGGLRGAAEYE
ncbi:MAG: hypothetical protein ACREBV_10735, partial [Candidatus Zixiibacteriota bacterium]